MRLQRPSPAMLVALLALFIALGGVGYAAVKLPRNSVGTKQLKRNAVTSAKIKDSSLLTKDFRAGQLPAGPKRDKGDKGDRGDAGSPGPTFGATRTGSPLEPASDPAASPDEASDAGLANAGRHFDVTLPADGNVYVRYFNPSWGVDCSSGGAMAGLYLDGAPVPKTAHPLPVQFGPKATELSGVVAAGAGAHAFEVRVDCPGGSISGQGAALSPNWTVLLLGG